MSFVLLVLPSSNLWDLCVWRQAQANRLLTPHLSHLVCRIIINWSTSLPCFALLAQPAGTVLKVECGSWPGGLLWLDCVHCRALRREIFSRQSMERARTNRSCLHATRTARRSKPSIAAVAVQAREREKKVYQFGLFGSSRGLREESEKVTSKLIQYWMNE